MFKKRLKTLLEEKFIESNEKYANINFAIIILMFIVSAVLLIFLPKQIPIVHNGDTEYPIPSFLGVWFIPIIALFINVRLIKQNRLSKMYNLIFGIALIAMTVYYITMI